MKKPLTIIFLIAILLTSCAPASLPPPTTAAITATITPSPTASATPTATPYPSLQTTGPYLLFTYDGNKLTIMDADGSGRKQFQLPNDGYIGYRFENAISPDGKWLAYFTGSTDEPYDIALNLFDLENETTFLIVNLIAPNFPQNLEPVIDILKFEDCINNKECKISAFSSAFINGIRSLEWSPDGKNLAFAAQIDGPSSDVYVFSTEVKTTLRLTNEPENIYRINWSPNGQKILYDTSITGNGFYQSSVWHLADLTITYPQSPKALSEEKPWRGHGWFNEDLYLISTGVDSPVYVDMGYINIDSKKLKIIWPYIAESITFDSESNKIILSFMPEIKNGELTAGTYLLYLDGTFTKISDEVFYMLKEQTSLNSYLAIGNKHSLVNISADGSIIHSAKTASSRGIARVSPHKNWILIKEGDRIKLFSKDLQLIKSWDIDASDIIWRIDSLGAFFYDLYDRDQLYYVSIPDGTPIPIDVCTSKDCWQFSYVWLP